MQNFVSGHALYAVWIWRWILVTRVVRRRAFDMFIGVVALLNLSTMLIETDAMATCAALSDLRVCDKINHLARLASHMCLVAYAFDVVLRVSAFRWRFFLSNLNTFDGAVVVLMLGCEAVSLLFGLDVVVLNVARVTRLVKLLVVRASFPEVYLRAGFMAVPLLAIMLVWTIIAVELLDEACKALVGWRESDICEHGGRIFETVDVANITLCQTMLMEGPWGFIITPLVDETARFRLLFACMCVTILLGFGSFALGLFSCGIVRVMEGNLRNRALPSRQWVEEPATFMTMAKHHASSLEQPSPASGTTPQHTTPSVSPSPPSDTAVASPPSDRAPTPDTTTERSMQQPEATPSRTLSSTPSPLADAAENRLGECSLHEDDMQAKGLDRGGEVLVRVISAEESADAGTSTGALGESCWLGPSIPLAQVEESRERWGSPSLASYRSPSMASSAVCPTPSSGASIVLGRRGTKGVMALSLLLQCPREEGTFLSYGSRKHQTCNCVPCKFFGTKRGCYDGVLCRDCHYPHVEVSRSAKRKLIARKGLAKRSCFERSAAPQVIEARSQARWPETRVMNTFIHFVEPLSPGLPTKRRASSEPRVVLV